ncbi:MAG: aminotransferase class III-fold pyridoxal phosphate-dependent enzyme, partial [Calditrichaeota bacterium]|nr:aminotransferase class III-fold pyridoxal phosphate-dependent enzyme [Calditrichota bacterium]
MTSSGSPRPSTWTTAASYSGRKSITGKRGYLNAMTSSIAPQDVRQVIGRHALTDGLQVVIDLEKSHGSWIVDAVTGKEYLDLFAMFASMTVGFNHPVLIANKDRLVAAAINKPTLSDIYAREYAEFVAALEEVGIPDYLPYAFFIEGGALAVENALKAAFDWKVRKNLAAGRGEKGSQVIHFQYCFRRIFVWRASSAAMRSTCCS